MLAPRLAIVPDLAIFAYVITSLPAGALATVGGALLAQGRGAAPATPPTLQEGA